MQKEVLNFFTLVRGPLKKITTNLLVKIEFTFFSMGLTRNFHGKKGSDILRSESGRGEYCIFLSAPLEVFVNGP